MVGMCLALLVLAAGCGRQAAESSQAAPPEDQGMRNVHGLGINPRDGMLYAATDTGVFRVSGRGQATRVGGRDHEVVGFTVVGPDRFLGSGHPDLGEPESQPSDWPPLLGLVESRDAGRTWRPLALRGEADFHDLTVAHGLVNGYESTFGRLIVSRDRAHWETLSSKTLNSFVVSLDNPEVLVATDEQGLAQSTDGGRRWRRYDRATPGTAGVESR